MSQPLDRIFLMASIVGRKVTVTSNNHGPIIAIATWFLMVAMTLAVIIRLAIKRFIRGSLSADDYTVSVSLILGIGQMITISLGINYGLGTRVGLLTDTQMVHVEQALYASNLLFVCAHALSKISVLQLLEQITTVKLQQTFAKYTALFIAIYSFPFAIAVGLQCGFSNPWNVQNGDCIDLTILWYIYSVLDILTELVTLLLPVFMVYQIQISKSKKTTVVIAFIFRALVIAATVCRLYYLSLSTHISDSSFSTVKITVATECVLSLSILTACIPCLKPFLDGFESGALDVHLGSKQSPLSSRQRELSYQLYHINSSTRKSMTSSATRRDLGYQTTIKRMGSLHEEKNSTDQIRQHTQERDERDDDNSSMQSNTMIIKRTDHWEIRYDEDPRAGSPGRRRSRSRSTDRSEMRAIEQRHSSLG